MKKNSLVEKFVSFWIIVAILTPTLVVFSFPLKTQAILMIVEDPIVGANTAAIMGTSTATSTATGTSASNSIWTKVKEVAKGVAMIAARKLINAITQRTVNWINSGFHGNPFYLENTEAFFKDILKYEVKNIVDVYAYNKAKFPFGRDFALNTINAYQRQAEDNASYTLSKVIDDPKYRDKFPAGYLESYRNDFNVGGWDGFFINTQYPQNNYLGFQMLATEELARKLDGTTTNAAQKVQDTLQKSQGFLAPETCTDNNGRNEYNRITKNPWVRPGFDPAQWQKDNPSTVCGSIIPSNTEQTNKDTIACLAGWTKRFEAAKAKWTEINGCKNLAVTTPGAAVSNQIMTALDSKIKQPELAAAMGNGLSAILDALITNLFDKAKGLRGSSSNAVQPVDPGPLGPNPTEDACTGGNPKCICAEGNNAYSAYEGAVADAEKIAYPNGLPAGTTGSQAQAAVCAAYTGPGTCKPAFQEDELIIEGIPGIYTTVSIDFLIGDAPYGSGALFSNAVAACEEGVQNGGTRGTPNTPYTPPPRTQKVITPRLCEIACLQSGGMGDSCQRECGVPDGPNMDAKQCIWNCERASGREGWCISECISAYDQIIPLIGGTPGGGAPPHNPPPPQE